MNDEAAYTRIAAVAKALAHPVRVQIVEMLAAQSECRGHEVFSELPLAQSTISQHLSVLKEAGIVSARPVGTAMVYCLDRSVLSSFAEDVSSLSVVAPCCADIARSCS